MTFYVRLGLYFGSLRSELTWSSAARSLHDTPTLHTKDLARHRDCGGSEWDALNPWRAALSLAAPSTPRGRRIEVATSVRVHIDSPDRAAVPC